MVLSETNTCEELQKKNHSIDPVDTPFPNSPLFQNICFKMKIILVSILLTFCYVQYTDGAFCFLLKGLVEDMLKDLIKKNLTLIEANKLEIPPDLNVIGEGYLDLGDVILYGLTNTDTSQPLIGCTDINNTALTLTITLDISRIGIDIPYYLDMGLLNAIPLYGNGTIDIGLSKILLDVSVIVTVKKLSAGFIYASDLDLNLKMHDYHSYITGFWNNPDVDKILTDVINLVEKLVVMFYIYERECFSCVLNPIVEYAVNTLLKYPTELKVDCDCLAHLFDNEYSVEENVKNVVNSLARGESKEVFATLFSSKMTKLYGELYDNFVAVMDKEGILDRHKLK